MKKALIAFVPVIHSGYIKFLKQQKGDIYIFDKSLIKSFVHLTRDLRMLGPEETVRALKILVPKRKIEVVSGKDIQKLDTQGYDFIMPEDEISYEITKKYITKGKVKYVSVFLRWTKMISTTEHVIPAHRKITTEAFHRKHIFLAKADAKKSADWWRQIGSLFWKDGEVISINHNHHLPSDHHLSTFGDPRSNVNAGEHQEIFTSIHSEASGVAEAAQKGVSLSGATVYVTTFPCPNCARLLGKAGIAKLYYLKGYSLLDAEKILTHFGVEIFLVQ